MQKMELNTNFRKKVLNIRSKRFNSRTTLKKESIFVQFFKYLFGHIDGFAT